MLRARGPGGAHRLRPRVRDAALRPRTPEEPVRRLPGVVRRKREVSQLTLSAAINSGLRRALADDPKVVLLGEDIGTLGGVFRVTDGLQKEFGADRVMDTPLAEAGIMGTAVGLAFRGYRPVVERSEERRVGKECRSRWAR